MSANAGRILREYRASIEAARSAGLAGYAGFPANKTFGTLLENIGTDVKRYQDASDGADAVALGQLVDALKGIIQRRRWPNGSGYNDFSETDVVAASDAVEAALVALVVPDDPIDGSEDSPIPFDPTDMPEMVEALARLTGSGQVAQFVAGLSLRLRGIFSDSRLKDILNPADPISLEGWLDAYIGNKDAANGEVAVLDLSLVSPDVLHILVAALGRLVLEANQRYHKAHNASLPVVLVLEEAHHFVRRRSGDEGWESPVEAVCRDVFERIAREGRKFGVGLVLSSQRPSELSPTVLAQCNTFLLHRLVNDRDQSLVARLVPDSLAGLLSELPSLPSRQAIVLGWATPVPVLVEMRELDEAHRPHSSDPEYWNVWTGESERDATWTAIADAWAADRPGPTSVAPES